MINSWNLPTSLDVAGTSYKIRSDFRDVLNCLIAFNDPEVDDMAKQVIMLKTIYVDWDKIPSERLEEAAKQAVSFIDAGMEDDGKNAPRVVDWEKDASIMVPSINAVAGQEVRVLPYLHWWTFLGYYMEIKDGLFAQVVGIRQKKASGKKLEKYEQEFYRKNKSMIDLAKTDKRSDEEQEALNKLFGLTGRR